eukprot:s4470_g1.t1
MHGTPPPVPGKAAGKGGLPPPPASWGGKGGMVPLPKGTPPGAGGKGMGMGMGMMSKGKGAKGEQVARGSPALQPAARGTPTNKRGWVCCFKGFPLPFPFPFLFPVFPFPVPLSLSLFPSHLSSSSSPLLSCAPKASAGPPARAAKRTQGQRLDAQTLYAAPLYDKQDLLYNLDRRQFNNMVVQGLDNEDITEPRPRTSDPVQNQHQMVLENLSVYWHGDYQAVSNGTDAVWDEKPYLHNGVTNPWLSDFVEVPDAEAFDPEKHFTSGPLTENQRRTSFEGGETPGTPRSDVTNINNPEYIVIYDTNERALLVSVKNPDNVAVLPEATDYFIERNHMNMRWFVSSPSLGLMAYASLLSDKSILFQAGVAQGPT